jgi:hypothetical protein
MKTSSKKLVGVIAAILLDAAHAMSKQALNEATRLAHAELENRKGKAKKKIDRWVRK